MRKLAWILVIGLPLLCSCAAVSPSHAPAGKPEVVIKGVDRMSVAKWIINELLNNGLQIRSIHDFVIVAGRGPGNAAENIPRDSRRDLTTDEQVTFAITETAGGVRVVASAALVTNPGSANEEVDEAAGGGAARTLQHLLDKMKSAVPKK